MRAIWYNRGVKTKKEIIRVDFCAHAIVSPFDEIKNVEQGYKLVKKLMGIGFSKVMTAPKFFPKKDMTKREITGAVTSARKQARGLNTTLKFDGSKGKVGLISEVFICKDMDRLVIGKMVNTLDDEYLMVKLPERGEISLRKVEIELNKLRKIGITPILCGPERAEFLQDDYGVIKTLSRRGTMFMGVYGSMIGENGKKAEKMLTFMLKEGICDFLGTDVSNENDKIFAKFDKAEKKILKITGENGYDKIMRNAEGVMF